MKKTNRFLVASLALLMSVSFVGCGDGEKREEENVGPGIANEAVTGTLAIRFFEGGFGRGWLDSVVYGFNQQYPNVKISTYPTTERQVLFSEMVAQNTTYDLYFSDSDLSDYTDKLMPLDEVYAYQWEGEDVTIGGKISSLLTDMYLAKDGHRYCLPSGVAAYGMTYNTNYIDEDEIPVTTDGLVALCDTLKGRNITPIIFSGGTSEKYYDFFYYQLYAQYQGIAEYEAAEYGQIINENGEKVFDVSSTYQQGALEAAQVLEDLLWYNNNNIVKTSTGLNFGEAQVQYLSDEAAAMMYNGSWLLNEMDAFIEDDAISMFKIPVISAIKDRCTTIADDAELAALVKAIDKKSTALSGSGYEVNQADFDRVQEARNFCYLASEAANACIVNSSKVNSGLAKLFLQYLYSNKGIEDFAVSVCGSLLPIDNVDYVGMIETKTGKPLNEFYISAYTILSQRKFCNAQTSAIGMNCVSESAQCFERQFGSQNSKDRTRAVDSFNARKTKYTANDNQVYWDSLYRSGLITSEQHANKRVD